MANHKRGRTRRGGFQAGALTPQSALALVRKYNAARERPAAEAEIAKTAVREVATVVEIIPQPDEQSRKRRRVRVNRNGERENEMPGSRSTGETPGQGGMTGLEKELHRARVQGAAEPEDAARTAFKRRKAAYSAIPVPKGLPELPPSTLTERPHPGIMPPRRPPRPEAKGPDPAEAPLTLSEAADQPAVQAAPLGEAALQQVVSENLGEAYVRPEQVTPPAELQA